MALSPDLLIRIQIEGVPSHGAINAPISRKIELVVLRLYVTVADAYRRPVISHAEMWPGTK